MTNENEAVSSTGSDSSVETLAPVAEASEEPMAGGEETTQPTAQSQKRSKPKTVRELVEYAYAEGGKKLQITRKDLDGLRVDHSDDGVASEHQLVRCLAQGDPLLQVPPRVLALVPLAPSRIDLRARLLDIALAAMISHPVFREKAVALQSRGFNPGDDREQLSAAVVSRAAKTVTHEQLGLVSDEYKDSARDKLKENAVTAFELFRVLRDQWDLSRFVADMSEHVWQTNKAARSGVGKQAVALASTVAIEPVNILLLHFDAVRKESEKLERELRVELAQAHRAMTEAAKRTHELESALEERDVARRQLEAQYASVQAELQAAQSQSLVDRSHLEDDYEVLRTQILRKLSSQVTLLGDGLHALRNDRIAVADEFIDRALMAISSEVARLKDLAWGAK